jgi:hypothetical protein
MDKRIAFLRDFIDDELETRELAMLPDTDAYVRRAAKAAREFDKLAMLMQDLRDAAVNVKEYDTAYGYSSDDEGLNRLSALGDLV